MPRADVDRVKDGKEEVNKKWVRKEDATKDCRADRNKISLNGNAWVNDSRQEKRVTLFVRGHGLYSCFSFIVKESLCFYKAEEALRLIHRKSIKYEPKKESFLQFVKWTNINQRGISDEPTIWAISHVRLLFCMLCKCFSFFSLLTTKNSDDVDIWGNIVNVALSEWVFLRFRLLSC